MLGAFPGLFDQSLEELNIIIRMLTAMLKHLKQVFGCQV